ncbi:gamma DNA-directed DNA polymerase, partial [Obba rivulosa]
MLSKLSPSSGTRSFHLSVPKPALQQKQLPARSPPPVQRPVLPQASKKEQEPAEPEIKRNEVGVQLLSRKLHRQIFRNVCFPPPSKTFTRIARDHLKTSGLDPAQSSVLPDTSFTLPPLQGSTLDEHFHRIGAAAAQPWLSLAKELAGAELPPKPDHWETHAGWTKYVYLPDGSSYCTAVEYPEHDGKPEEMLVFDVETLPAYSPFAIMACAVSKNAWYSWVSPWLLGETEDMRQLIPLGGGTVPKVVVGHNVSYDRGRILDEYNIHGTQNRFLDTMALHVAVSGISSHQRPAWELYRQSKKLAVEQRDEAIDAVCDYIEEAEQALRQEMVPEKRAELERVLQEMRESLPALLAKDSLEADEEQLTQKRWEDLTSANSLADVARLHCGIDLDKEVRNDFMTCSREEIREGLQDYLQYCASDVAVTHAVFTKTLPAFLTSCPSPVSFAGVLTMGSALLPVNQEWEAYIASAEAKYNELGDGIKKRLIDLALEAKEMVEGEKWKDDPWLSQMDWTPKVAGKTRGIFVQEATETSLPPEEPEPAVVESAPVASDLQPAWFKEFNKLGPLYPSIVNRTLPFLLKTSFDGHPLEYSVSDGWHYLSEGQVTRLPTATTKVLNVLSLSHGKPHLTSGRMTTIDDELATAIASGDRSSDIADRLRALARQTAVLDPEQAEQDPWLRQLKWKMVQAPPPSVDVQPEAKPKKTKAKSKAAAAPKVYWPKWFWDLAKPKKDMPPGTLDLTVRNRFSPLLLRLSWKGYPLFHSREHGWTFRVPVDAEFESRSPAVEFHDAADAALQDARLRGFVFYKLPHKDGEKANVGNPLAKTFMKYAEDRTLTSPFEEAKDALDMNAQCSYWISARDRVLKQVVVWQDKALDIGVPQPEDPAKKWGIILPQVITMGTVTRRAIEKTWLTASNAKANRVGSELKAMVRAPPGYAIVGADVDSEELWISSVMGDAQFGLHGATAIGWMTLEGTKAAGTDLHSKTASILGISRNQAKVFNYSRIYGAGMRHAVLLLLQSNPGMLPEQAQKLAQNLYASTKGKNTHRGDLFGRKFWFGGTESYVFNKLEEIALSDRPQTPALGCGITYALSKEYLPEGFGSDYMPSRINWVVQSSGVDYLHLLIVAMEHLITKYNIQARYLISVHDELRYLVKDEDRYRAALALQIANLWTRSLFAFKLGMDDLPQGVAFFSVVDIDHVLRKEVDMPCVTPSQPHPIPPGESLDIAAVLRKTHGGSLWPDGAPMSERDGLDCGGDLAGYREPDCL